MSRVEKYSKIVCIDIGTVTSRLAKAEFNSFDKILHAIQKESRICDLGEGLAESGFLSDAAINRVLTASASFIDEARAWGARTVVCTLTSAAREATNSALLLKGLQEQGLVPHIIPGSIEARLTFMGVASDFIGRRLVVCDSGGGSTELAVGSLQASGKLELEDVISLPIGARRITDMFLLASNPPTAVARKQAFDYCSQLFTKHMPAALRNAALHSAGQYNTALPIVAVGGTATSLVAMDKKLQPYDASVVHLSRITTQNVAELTELLGSMTTEQRAQVVGLQPARAGVILGGAIAVQALLCAADASCMQVSEHDLLYGLAQAAYAAQCGVQSFEDWEIQVSHLC